MAMLTGFQGKASTKKKEVTRDCIYSWVIGRRICWYDWQGAEAFRPVPATTGQRDVSAASQWDPSALRSMQCATVPSSAGLFRVVCRVKLQLAGMTIWICTPLSFWYEAHLGHDRCDISDRKPHRCL